MIISYIYISYILITAIQSCIITAAGIFNQNILFFYADIAITIIIIIVIINLLHGRLLLL